MQNVPLDDVWTAHDHTLGTHVTSHAESMYLSVGMHPIPIMMSLPPGKLAGTWVRGGTLHAEPHVSERTMDDYAQDVA